MKYFLLKQPTTEDYYYDTWLNGNFEHEFCTPGIECSICGKYGSTRQIPCEANECLKKILDIYRKDKHSDLLHLNENEYKDFASKAIKCIESRLALPLDDNFQGQLMPCTIDIPFYPESDFLWSGPYFCVSDRIRKSLLGMKQCGLEFFPVVFKKVGKSKIPNINSTTFQNYVEQCLDEYDIWDYVNLLPMHAKNTPNYFAAIPLRSSKTIELAYGDVAICKKCGRASYGAGQRIESFSDEMSSGFHFQYLKSTLNVVISEEIKDAFEKNKYSNFECSAFTRLSF
jgi:hypothetical protein